MKRIYLIGTAAGAAAGVLISYFANRDSFSATSVISGGVIGALIATFLVSSFAASKSSSKGAGDSPQPRRSFG